MRINQRSLTIGGGLALVLGGWLGLTAASEAQSLRPLLRPKPPTGFTNIGPGGLLNPISANPGIFANTGALQTLPQAGGNNAQAYRGFREAMWSMMMQGGANSSYYNGLMNPYMNNYQNPYFNPYQTYYSGLNPYSPFLAQGQVVGMSPWQMANPFWQFNQNPWNNFNGGNPFLDPAMFGWGNGFGNGFGWGNGLGNWGGNPFLMTGMGNGLGNQGNFVNPFLMPNFGGQNNNNPLPAQR